MSKSNKKGVEKLIKDLRTEIRFFQPESAAEWKRIRKGLKGLIKEVKIEEIKCKAEEV